MQRIVVDCHKNGCTREPRWVLSSPATVKLRWSCDQHLAENVRAFLRQVPGAEYIGVQGR